MRDSKKIASVYSVDEVEKILLRVDALVAYAWATGEATLEDILSYTWLAGTLQDLHLLALNEGETDEVEG